MDFFGFALPALLWWLLRVLVLVCLIHAAMHRQWLWVAFLAIGLLFNGGILTAVFYTFFYLLPSLQGSGTRARRTVKNTVQAGIEAAKTLDTRIKEARAALERSDTLTHRTTLANLLARDGQTEEAQLTLQPLLTGIYCDDPMVLLTAAQLDLAQGHPAKAEEKLTRVELQTSASTKVQALLLLARAQTEQGRPAEADSSYREAVRVTTTEEPRARYAQFLLEQGRQDEAGAVLDKLLQIENEATPLYRKQEREWFELAGRLRKRLRQK